MPDYVSSISEYVLNMLGYILGITEFIIVLSEYVPGTPGYIWPYQNTNSLNVFYYWIYKLMGKKWSFDFF